MGLYFAVECPPASDSVRYLGPSSWPRQVAATRNPWLTSPSDLNLSDRWLIGRTGAKSAWVVSGGVQHQHTRGILFIGVHMGIGIEA